MNSKLFVTLALAAIVFCMLNSAPTEAASCSSLAVNQFYSNYTTFQTSYNCPIGYMNYQEGTADRKCETYKTLAALKVGKACALTSDCIFSSLSCVGSVCVPKALRIEGDACTVKDNCAGTFKKSALNCASSKCAQYTKTTSKVGEACNVVSDTANTISTCDSTATCLLDGLTTYKCYTKKTSAAGAECGKISSADNSYTVCGDALYCDSTLVCKAATIVKEGVACDQVGKTVGTACDTGLICRKKIAGAAVTCEKRSTWAEYCDTTADCLANVAGQVTCLKNKCTRVASVKVDGECDFNTDCFSGVCVSGKCSAGTAKCDNAAGNSCPTGTACGCGGLGYAADTQGNCMPACNGWVSEAIACLWNFGVDAPASFISTIGAGQVVDDASGAITKCATQLQNVLLCYKSSYAVGGVSMATTKDTLGSATLDLSGTLGAIPDKVALPEVRSAASGVVSGACMVVMMLIAFFAL